MIKTIQKNQEEKTRTIIKGDISCHHHHHLADHQHALHHDEDDAPDVQVCVAKFPLREQPQPVLFFIVIGCLFVIVILLLIVFLLWLFCLLLSFCYSYFVICLI